ncbi:MAG: hypothetical protein HZA78_11300 [Candidatus Schekmanbacteria bacterium]|nr:hypothetical protein [Candidatus Schekmanbacteria bacterium]
MDKSNTGFEKDYECLKKIHDTTDNLINTLIKYSNKYFHKYIIKDKQFIKTLRVVAKENSHKLFSTFDMLLEDKIGTQIKLKSVGLADDNLSVKASSVKIYEKLFKKTNTKFALDALFDLLVLIFESLSHVFKPYEVYVEFMKLVKILTRLKDDPSF